jgi:hypothetical protein
MPEARRCPRPCDARGTEMPEAQRCPRHGNARSSAMPAALRCPRHRNARSSAMPTARKCPKLGDAHAPAMPAAHGDAHGPATPALRPCRWPTTQSCPERQRMRKACQSAFSAWNTRPKHAGGLQTPPGLPSAVAGPRRGEGTRGWT